MRARRISQDEKLREDQNLGKQMKECWEQVLLRGSLSAALITLKVAKQRAKLWQKKLHQ